MDAVRNLKVNLKLENKPCGWCAHPLALGDDAAVCGACSQAHHQACWDSKSGCATAGCASAPLRRIDPPVASAVAASVTNRAVPLGPGLMHCPRCGSEIGLGVPLCPVCRAITSPDGLYHGPLVNAPGAVASLVYAIIGLFVCGVILGPVAISKSNAARQAMRTDPTLGGGGLATAGMVIGVLDIVAFVVIMLIKVGAK
jgi:Domain of unknown function (DUF4190)/Prokaryotic RING finger family 1